MKNKILSLALLSLTIVTQQGHAVSSIAAGDSHSVVLTNDGTGTALAWGNNNAGSLGNGTTNSSNAPVVAKNLSGATVVATGANFTLAIKGGALYGWGNNYYGQIGDGSTTSYTTPLASPYLQSDVTAIAAGDNFGLAIKGGALYSWGYNGNGQLGDGTTTSHAPRAINGMTGISAIAANSNYALALKSDGTIWTWGNNYSGLGLGNITSTKTPTQISSLANIVAIAAGKNHALALSSSGSIYAWGDNSYCELGVATKSSYSNYAYCNSSTTPVAISSIGGVSAIAAGDSFSLALKTDGTVWAWGTNSYGTLGTTTTGNSNVTPLQVDGLSGVTAIATRNDHVLALTSSQKIYAWGANESGQIGNTDIAITYGSYQQTATPVNGLGGYSTLSLANIGNSGSAASTTTSSTSNCQASLSSSNQLTIPCLTYGADQYNAQFVLEPISGRSELFFRLTTGTKK